MSEPTSPPSGEAHSARRNNPRAAEAIIIAIVLALHLLLSSPTLMPAMAEINPHDEAKYIESGRLLIRGQTRDLAWAPLVSLVYAPIHFALGGGPSWFLIEAWVGRFVLFLALWLSTYLLAMQLRSHLHPFIAAGVLFVSVPFYSIVVNQSDAVFMSLSALALARIISYHRLRRLRDVLIASALVGLGALARVETTLLIPVLVVMALAVWGRRSQAWRALLAATLPAAAVAAFYLLLARTGAAQFDASVWGKAYDSFEWNQAILTGGDLEQARSEVHRIFGTSEQNQGSVLRAIMRNPHAFGLRVLANGGTIPENYLTIFGKKLGPLLLLFSGWGAYALIRRQAIGTLLILLIWPLHSLISLGFLALHLVPQVGYLPLVLGSIGISYAFSPGSTASERAANLLLLASLTLYGLIDAKPAFLAAGLLVFVAALLISLVRERWREAGGLPVTPFLILLAAGLILRGGYEFPNYPEIGQSPEERAVHYLQRELPAESLILVPFPRPAVAARLRAIEFAEAPREFSGPSAFEDWLAQEGITAVYLDRRYGIRPDIVALASGDQKSRLEQGFISEDGAVRVLLVRERSSQQ